MKSLRSFAGWIRSILILPLLTPLIGVFAWGLSKLVPGNYAHSIFARHGFILLRPHYYLPFPEADESTFLRDTELVGVDMNEDAALELLDTVIQQYKAEFNTFPIEPTSDTKQFYLRNGTFMAIDGNVYYALIRHLKPAKVIEIGSGQSTKLASAAVRKNREEANISSQLICIEPYPKPYLREISEITQLVEAKAQTVSLALFESLQDGDILFIDSTHVLRPGGDVWWEYCEILPRLAPGVLVHIHDISLPQPYPKVYFEKHLYWNEQYVLQCFLAFNNRFEVIWPGNYLMTKHPERIRAAFLPEYVLMLERYPNSGPSSLWMRVRE